MNVLLHISQQYGRSPVCTCWCAFSELLWMNVLLHTSQQYGRSPVCTRWCTFMLCLSMTLLLHTSQRYGRSPVSKRWCSFSLCLFLNVLLHTPQGYVCSTIRIRCWKKRGSNITILKCDKNITKCKLQISYTNNISKDWCYKIQLSTKSSVDYRVLTIHESNAPFPVTRH